MSNKEARKKALEAYKERKEVGGIYYYANTENGWKSPLLATPNLQGAINALAFAQRTGHCTFSHLKEQWQQSPPEAFSLVVVERLEKKAEQTPADFQEELKTLWALHQEA